MIGQIKEVHVIASIIELCATYDKPYYKRQVENFQFV